MTERFDRGEPMGWMFALESRDPNLSGCVLHALHAQAALHPPAAITTHGLGYYTWGDPLLERRAGAHVPFDLHAAEDIDSEVLLAHADAPASPKDDNCQPFRFRKWLFAHAGEVADFAQAKPALHRALPEFWQGHRKGDTASEYVFLYVLKRLRDRTGLDDADLAAEPLARALSEGVTDFERVLRDAGVTRPSGFACAFTNGQSVAVLRSGAPCSYRLVEGLVPCARCGIDERTPDTHPALRPHRMLRAVAFVSEVGSAGFTAMEDRSVMTISPKLELRTERF